MRPEVSFLGQPVRSLQTMLRMIYIHHGHFPTLIPDGIYGPQTANAVSAFQRSVGLPVTGIADQATWAQIVTAYQTARIDLLPAHPLQIVLNPGQILRAGSQDPTIRLVQCLLLCLSETFAAVPTLSISGILDAQTARAISAFQSLAGLSTTGEIDKITWKHLVLQYQLAAPLPRHLSVNPETPS